MTPQGELSPSVKEVDLTDLVPMSYEVKQPKAMFNRILISPPFGNYLNIPGTTSVRGSFTLHKRPGLIWNTIKTLRKVEGGWRNKIGLRNCGIKNVKFDDPRDNRIYSIVGLDAGDWEHMYIHMPFVVNTIEINLGCPNVHEYSIPFDMMRTFCKDWNVIAKLTPDDTIDKIAEHCINAGADFLHCSNTIPTAKGGISGKQLFDINLPIVERLAKRYPGKIIAGGGIYNVNDLIRYYEVGATHFSLSTICITHPQEMKLIIAYAKMLDNIGA